MRIEAGSPEEYIAQIPKDRVHAFTTLIETIGQNIPAGFKETMSYGMIGWVVPLEIYPLGYHVDPSLPLPFINLGNQKNYLAMYHSGLYADPEISQWFVNAYAKSQMGKLDMGKSCVRFKNYNQIPYDVIAELCTKFSVKQWIALYESKISRK